LDHYGVKDIDRPKAGHFCKAKYPFMANLTLPKAARLREKTLACNRQTLPEQARPCEKKASSCNRQTLPEQARPCWKIFALHHSPPCRKTEGGASPAPLPRLLISCRKAFFAFPSRQKLHQHL
jgi:hypothetical protein